MLRICACSHSSVFIITNELPKTNGAGGRLQGKKDTSDDASTSSDPDTAARRQYESPSSEAASPTGKAPELARPPRLFLPVELVPPSYLATTVIIQGRQRCCGVIKLLDIALTVCLYRITVPCMIPKFDLTVSKPPGITPFDFCFMTVC